MIKLEKQDFLRRFDEVKRDGKFGHRTREDVCNLIRQHMLTMGQPDVPIGFQELFISVEELAELSQAITKALRGKPDEVNLVEELADVYMVLNYIQTVLYIDHDDVRIAEEVKIRKLEELLEKAKKDGVGLHDKHRKGLL